MSELPVFGSHMVGSRKLTLAKVPTMPRLGNVIAIIRIMFYCGQRGVMNEENQAMFYNK